mgnify:CR=1 FL=1
MKKWIGFFILVTVTGLWAQANNSIVAEVDYFNATRYAGSRNIARTSNGNLLVVFEPAAAYTNGNQEIHYVTYNSFFNEWDPAVALSQSSQNSTGIPSIVADDNGRAFATWKELMDDGKRDMMFSKWEGGSWSTPASADDIDNNTGVGTINLAANGDLFISFSIWNDPAVFDPNMYVSRSTDLGVTWTTTNLNTEYPTPGELPFLYMDSDISPLGADGMMAVWEDKPLPETTQYEIMMSLFTPASGWSRPEIISPILDGVPATARYVDGCTPRPGALSIYEMSGDDYPLAGQTATIYYDNGTSRVLSSFFNPYFQFPLEDRDSLIVSVFDFFGLDQSADILFVDDDNKWNNEAIMTDVLDNLSANYTNFDCGDIGGIPTNLPSAADLAGRDLVIWYTGDDGALDNLAFWNVQDADNAVIKSYLDNGGSLWVVGRDWMYDRYGAADGGSEDSYSTGDFCYDYLGIQSYDSQSYTDADGITGVPSLSLVAGSGFQGLDPIVWGNAGTRDGEPSLATDPSGYVHMAAFRGDGSHIYHRKYIDGSWTDPFRVDVSPDTILVQRPNIAVDRNHGVYITWVQRGVDGIYNVMYRTSPDAGVTWNEVTQLSTCNYLNASNYSIILPTMGRKVRPAGIGFEGGADVVWTEASDNSSMGYYIKYARIPYAGAIPVGVDVESEKPDRFQITRVYPNPFNASVQVEIEMEQTSRISATIYDLRGRQVASLIGDKTFASGKHLVNWDARGFASGLYILKLEGNQLSQIAKLNLIK